MDILWLRPNKPANISVGRQRIALKLEERGHNVNTRNATLQEFRQVLHYSPDVVLGTTRLGAFVGTWKKMFAGTPLVIDHVDPISQLRRSHNPATVWGVSQAEKIAFRIADHVMVVYEEALSRVQRYTSNITHTTLGVNYDQFSSPPEKTIQNAREVISNHVPADQRILIYVGGLAPPYHLPAIVDAMDHLEGWHFVVLGDGSQREWFEAVADKNETIHYLGTVPYEEVPGYLHLADVGISLINDINTPKILEYGAANLPVVHRGGSADSVFEDEVTFCSLEPANIARAIEQAVSADTSSLDKYAQERSWESIADEYNTVLTRLVSKK